MLLSRTGFRLKLQGTHHRESDALFIAVQSGGGNGHGGSRLAWHRNLADVSPRNTILVGLGRLGPHKKEHLVASGFFPCDVWCVPAIPDATGLVVRYTCMPTEVV